MAKLLDPSKGASIYIDLKHMSLTARKEFYPWHKSQWPDCPFVVSHGAFTGCRMSEASIAHPDFAADEINFFDRQLQALTQLIDATRLRLDALRVIVTM